MYLALVVVVLALVVVVVVLTHCRPNADLASTVHNRGEQSSGQSRPSAFDIFLGRGYCYKSFSTQIPHDARLAPIPYRGSNTTKEVCISEYARNDK